VRGFMTSLRGSISLDVEVGVGRRELPGGTTSRVRKEFRGRGMVPARDGEPGSARI
jgi:hypothetical protein